jgi:hypothetical protein
VEATALSHKRRKVLWTPRQSKTFCELIRTVEGVWPNYPITRYGTQQFAFRVRASSP